MKILITGGAGFIASHIADACIREGYDVTIVDDLSVGKRENVNPNAAFYQIDIRDPKLKDVFANAKFDTVIHHAAQMDVRKSVDDPTFDASVNILGSINLLENSLRYGVGKFMFASTGGAIYGEQEYFPADERHPLRPLSPYGVAKLSVEKYLFYYEQVHGLRSISLRYANVYGPRQNPHGEAGVIAIFTDKMLKGEHPIINGDGTQTRDYTYIDDVVRANLFALRHQASAIFNVGTGLETDVNTLFRILNSLTGGGTKEMHAPAKKGEQRRSVLDYSLIAKTFGWKPTVALEEGLRRTVEFFRMQPR